VPQPKGLVQLVEKSVDLDFASRTEVHTSFNNDRDDEARRQRGAVALVILFRRVDRRAKFRGVKCVTTGLLSGVSQGLVATTQTMPFFLPSAETEGVAPGFANFIVDDALNVR
jgi:hypothetical protein